MPERFLHEGWCRSAQTHTHVSGQCAGNPRATQNGCSLPAPQLEAYCPMCVCPCCHRKQSLKHPLVSIGYLLHKIQTTHTSVLMQIMAKSNISEFNNPHTDGSDIGVNEVNIVRH